MNPFPLSSRGAEIFDEIKRERPRLGLTLGKPARAGDRIACMTDEEIVGGEVKDPSLAKAARAGLLLSADHFAESHSVCQALETVEGSYWHGILHRREPDPSNAKYWFRRVGYHPIWPVLVDPPAGHPARGSKALADVTQVAGWDPERFVDACASLSLLRAAGGKAGPGDEYRAQLEDLEEWEVFCLLRFCVEGAAGGPRPARRPR